MKLQQKFLCLSLIVTSLLLIFGCGGGTVGTDDGATLRVSGTVADMSGAALTNALVIIESTGDSSRSDDQGRFEISTAQVSQSRFRIDAIIAGQEISLSSNLVVFDSALDSQRVEITISVDNASVTVEDLNVSPVQPTPTPGPHSNQPTPVQSPTSRSIIIGVVRNQFSQPVKGVELTLEGERSSTFSAGDGSFELNFLSTRTRIGLLLKYQGRRARISLSGLPKTPSLIKLKLAMVVLDENQITTEEKKPIEVQYDFQIRPVKP
jgi:hypothetical protein